MPKRSSTGKGKQDFSQIALSIVQEITAEPSPSPVPVPPEPLSTALDDEETRKAVMKEMGRRGGKKGGKARASKLSPEDRVRIAKQAAAARWKKEDSSPE